MSFYPSPSGRASLPCAPVTCGCRRRIPRRWRVARGLDGVTFRNQGESELYSCRGEDCVWAAWNRRKGASRFLTCLCDLRSDQADAFDARGVGDVNGLGDLGKSQLIIALYEEHAPGPVGKDGCQPAG